MTVKFPTFLVDHPWEGVIAVALLLGLLFISADGAAPMAAAKTMQVAAQKN
jgi:hypothetical protein